VSNPPKSDALAANGNSWPSDPLTDGENTSIVGGLLPTTTLPVITAVPPSPVVVVVMVMVVVVVIHMIGLVSGR